MSAEEWFSLGYSGYRESKEDLVRVWQPGDGIRCAAAAYQKREPCGPPVAVVQTVKYRSHACESEIRTNRVVCAEHLASRVAKIQSENGRSRSQAINDAVKKATDELVTKYWKQYQALYQKHLDASIADLLSNIPEPLRPLVSAALEEAAEKESA